mgnify:CR=1 FL=1
MARQQVRLPAGGGQEDLAELIEGLNVDAQVQLEPTAVGGFIKPRLDAGEVIDRHVDRLDAADLPTAASQSRECGGSDFSRHRRGFTVQAADGAQR